MPNTMLTLFNLTINFLVTKCHATVILCSATQPSFENAEHKLLSEVSDLITLPSETLKVFERVELVDKGSMSMEELSDFALEIIRSKKSLLVVCNTKREAKELFESLQAEVNGVIPMYHLSASMCTKHRKMIVESMKIDLSLPDPKQIVCVATQVIEAGVDISFNCVIRLQAGMDSIVQAAGRCNRNGENKLESVYIVNLLGEKLHRLKEIETAKRATESLLQEVKIKKHYTSLNSDAAISFYYKKLYSMMNKGEQDFFVPNLHKSLYGLLNQHDVADGYFLAQQLKTAGKYFNVFDNNTVEMIVPYGKGQDVISELNSEKAMYNLAYAEEAIKQIREKVGDGKVLLALSGGVDSSVACALLSKAVGNQLTCVFVDHGFMRKNEGDEVEQAFKDWDVNFIRVNAADRFIGKLEGVSDPETKRKTIGEEFIRVFEEEAKKIGKVDFLVHGTIYPDVIESGTGDAAVIKSHHNVGGLPDYVDFKEIIEPLRLLFKDEVRKLGTELGLSDVLVWRQPFPGPGLAIRIIGEITREKLATLQDADYIFREEIAKAGLDRSINQYFAVLTNMRSVGVMGDDRTYDYTLALRGVTTSDFMTADFARIPYDVLEKASVRIVNEVKNINRICYDITSKPPATIEWE